MASLFSSEFPARWLSRGVLLALTGIAGGCDESLPPRNDPEEFLTVGFRSSVLVVVDATVVREGWGTVHIVVKNIHDEVLSEDALVRAQLTVRLADKPEVFRLLEFGPLDLLDRRILRGRTVTLGVDSVADLYKYWDHRETGGSPFWDHVVLTRKLTDKGVPYYESDSVRCIAEGTVQLFENVQQRKVGPVIYPIVYQIWNMPGGSNKR